MSVFRHFHHYCLFTLLLEAGKPFVYVSHSTRLRKVDLFFLSKDKAAIAQAQKELREGWCKCFSFLREKNLIL